MAEKGGARERARARARGMSVCGEDRWRADHPMEDLVTAVREEKEKYEDLVEEYDPRQMFEDGQNMRDKAAKEMIRGRGGILGLATALGIAALLYVISELEEVYGPWVYVYWSSGCAVSSAIGFYGARRGAMDKLRRGREEKLDGEYLLHLIGAK